MPSALPLPGQLGWGHGLGATPPSLRVSALCYLGNPVYAGGFQPGACLQVPSLSPSTHPPAPSVLLSWPRSSPHTLLGPCWEADGPACWAV